MTTEIGGVSKASESPIARSIKKEQPQLAANLKDVPARRTQQSG
jgi:hypothetical protein